MMVGYILHQVRIGFGDSLLIFIVAFKKANKAKQHATLDSFSFKNTSYFSHSVSEVRTFSDTFR